MKYVCVWYVGREVDGKKGDDRWEVLKEKHNIGENIFKRLKTTIFGERMKKWIFSYMN